MRSIADDLRRDLRRAQRARSAAERLRTAFSLGDADAGLLACARGMTVDAARRLIQRQRQHGRRPSACHGSILT